MAGHRGPLAAVGAALAAAVVVLLSPVPSAAVTQPPWPGAPAPSAPGSLHPTPTPTTPPAPSTVEIGRSRQGRQLLATRYGFPTAPRTVVVIGLLHGDEPAGLKVVAALRSLTPPTDTQLWVVPSGNPDGLAAGRRTNAAGVDLNRNFPNSWVYAGRGTSTYSGPKAASEPETAALVRFLSARRPALTVIFHQPLYGVDSYHAKNPAWAQRLATAMGLPLKSFSCGGTCHGTLTGWHNATLPGMGLTVEFGSGTPSSAKATQVAKAVLTVR
jgi:predicted deacylase